MQRQSRKLHRHRTFKTGKIILNNRCSVIDCKIKDQSLRGAKLDLGAMTQLPDEFELLVLPERKSWLVQFVWQKGALVGVGFTGTAQTARG
jgi:hypothetical protein